MTLLLDDDDVRRSVDYPTLVDRLDDALLLQAAGDVAVPGRINVEHAGSWLRVMPAVLPAAGIMGLKVFHGGAAHGVRYLVLLFSTTDGRVLAAVDAKYLTAARTAATSAAAFRRLARTTTGVRVGVIGSGLEAETHCAAFAAVADLASISVYSPNPGRREGFAQRVGSELGLPAVACDTAEEVVAGADAVIVATNTGASRMIACRGPWLRPGQHVTAIGSTNVDLRELDTDVFTRADTVVFDAAPADIAEESGDVLQLIAEGGSVASAAVLSDVVAGVVPGRRNDTDITLFKSVGTALQDLVAAYAVYESATAHGRGDRVPDLAREKLFARSLAVSTD